MSTPDDLPPITDDRHEVIAEVVSLYYLHGWDQRQIAQKFDVSRSTVSRMIAEARQRRIVEIKINRPTPTRPDLRRRAMERFGLRDALVLDASAVRGELLPRVATLSAQFVDQELLDDGVLAISWGTSVAATADALPGSSRRGVTVVQMIGAVGSPDPAVDGAELARRMAMMLGGTSVALNAPLVVDDADLARALRRQPSVASVFERAAGADLALVGLGAMDPEVSSLVRAGYASPAVLARAARAGVVGDIAGVLLTADGQTADSELGERLVALDEAGLRAIPTVVAVAVGLAKVDIILAALLSGIVDVIATDSDTLTTVLARAGAAPPSLPKE